MAPSVLEIRYVVDYDAYRIRVSRCRILYSFSRRNLVILVLEIGHRRDVYR